MTTNQFIDSQSVVNKISTTKKTTSTTKPTMNIEVAQAIFRNISNQPDHDANQSSIEINIPTTSPQISPYHICIDGDGVYSPLPHDYYHKFYNHSLLYDFKCPYNSTITSINNTISHFKFNASKLYYTFVPIIISFQAYNIYNKPQKYGGDEFIVYVNNTDNQSFAFQAFQVEDLFNGTYNIHILLSYPTIYIYLLCINIHVLIQ